MSFALAVVLTLTAADQPSSLSSQTVTTRKTWLWATGLSLAVASYVAMGAVTTGLCSDNDPAPCQPHVVPASWIPVAGPWIILPTASTGQAVALISGGIVELGGIAMLILGLVLKEERVIVTPMAGAGRAGIALSGRF